MMFLVQAILMGIFATAFMDLSAKFVAKWKIIQSPVGPEAIGRWFLYMFRGKFVHKDINETPPLKNEKLWSLIVHYLIGIALAGLYLYLDQVFTVVHENVWLVLVFGIVTIVFPWFWLAPATGFGVMASKASNRPIFLRTNFINHFNFGLGMFLWIVSVHKYFL